MLWVKIITILDKEFPLRLKIINQNPVLIYYKGHLSCLNKNKSIALIGTRVPTYYGEKVSYKLGKILSQNGFVVISGLALGCDTFAHRGCLDAKGNTIAVMPCGLDIVYPYQNKELYKKMGIRAYIFNIEEREQYKQVYTILQRYKPEILVLTGHDAFVKRRNDIYNIDNYKNSKYFVQSVIEARKYEHNLDNLVIFAGACQGYYEALISAGANFASAPKRVLIDMMDPMIVAENVAYTSVNEFVSLENIIANTREGINGIGGMQTRGQYRIGMPGI